MTSGVQDLRAHERVFGGGEVQSINNALALLHKCSVLFAPMKLTVTSPSLPSRDTDLNRASFYYSDTFLISCIL